MEIYGLTDRGAVREANEDSIGISRTKNGITIAVVCDGMGGAAGGRIASEVAEETFMASMLACADEMEQLKFDPKKVKAFIEEAAAKANAAVLAKAREDLSLFGMGCTLNALIYIEHQHRIYYVNVGDSRLYMITKKEIKQLTKDHSYVQYLLDMGQITEKEAESFPNKNVITRAVGTSRNVVADYFEVQLKAGDKILLCSDGLSNMLGDEEMHYIINRFDGDVEKAARTLIDRANDNGGKDNISVVLVQV